MNNQIYIIIIAFFISGLVIGIVFDIFRITRKTFKIPNIITYIEDILFWILTGSITLFTIFKYTDGQIRLYMILILIMGVFAYFIVLSKFFIMINTKILEFIKFVLRTIAKPFTILWKILAKTIKNIELKKIFKKFSKNSAK